MERRFSLSEAIKTDVRDRHGDQVAFYRRPEGPASTRLGERYGPGLSFRENIDGQ